MDRPAHRTLLRTLAVALLLASSTSAFAQSYADSLTTQRAENDHAIKEELIGPFTAIGQASLHDGKAMRVALYPDTVLLGHPTADVGVPTLEVIWKQDQGAVYLRTPLGGRFEVRHSRVGPVPMNYTPGDTIFAGRFLMQIYRGAATARIMVFDPQYPAREHFEGLHYFDPDPAWRVTASVKPVADSDTVAMTTSLGLTKYYARHSRLSFTTPDGKQAELTLFVPASGADYGFLPFTDATTGDQTYGGGRYLDVEPPADGQQTIVLDFNNAYNPYCAYTHFYNCPIPPAENNLDVAVTAGEKAYK